MSGRDSCIDVQAAGSWSTANEECFKLIPSCGSNVVLSVEHPSGKAPVSDLALVQVVIVWKLLDEASDGKAIFRMGVESPRMWGLGCRML